VATPSALHEHLADLAFLLGTWSGTGEGVWPTGEPFDYGEDITFEHARPVTELRRRIEARGEELSFELHMAMEGVELFSHVRSRLACA
jgi:hypothetical protein